MIELGKIMIKDEISIVEARNKIRLLAEDLKFDPINATRLATITSELSRVIYQEGRESSIEVGFDSPRTFEKGGHKKRETYGLTLAFQSKIKEIPTGKADTFFDKSRTSARDGFQRVEAFKYIPDPEFRPTKEFIKTERERLLRVSKAELFNEIKRKHEELLGLLDERNSALKELEEKTEEIEKATRLKSEFLANMSHELRTPLNSIIGFTHRVIKKHGDVMPEKHLKNLRTVEKNAHILLGLINSLLDISKIEAGKMGLFPEEFDIGSLISEVIELTQTLASDKGLELDTEISDKQMILHSDKTKLKQIMINLVSNAIKFTNEGSIIIRTRLADGAHAGSDMFFEPGTSYLAISVIDSGEGMSPEDMDYVFEPFRQVDGSTTRKTGGTGLGLSIVKRFTEILKGKIEVDSVEGKGSSFTLTIPMSIAPWMDVLKKEEVRRLEKREPLKTGPTVLCIDDDPEVLDLLHSYLSDEGYGVTVASGGEDGLKKARELKPFAITLDIQMPHMDGWSVLKELKDNKTTMDIPVIIVSIMDNIALGYKLGASDYLQKPILPEALMNTMNRLLEQRAETVLVVDDDPDVIDLMKQILEDKKINVRGAENGLRALEILKEKPPELILLDLMMPEMDGFELLSRLKKVEEWQEIPVVIITAKVLKEEEMKFLEKRTEAIITKEGMDTGIVLEQIVKALRRIEVKKS